MRSRSANGGGGHPGGVLRCPKVFFKVVRLWVWKWLSVSPKQVASLAPESCGEHTRFALSTCAETTKTNHQPPKTNNQ